MKQKTTVRHRIHNYSAQCYGLTNCFRLTTSEHLMQRNKTDFTKEYLNWILYTVIQEIPMDTKKNHK